jgi:hypothetical protein
MGWVTNSQSKMSPAMHDWPPFVPYLILAFICGLASVVIAYLALMTVAHSLHTPDVGFYAMVGMVAAPAVMGIGIAAHMPQK